VDCAARQHLAAAIGRKRAYPCHRQNDRAQGESWVQA
jgi:hypothetical protein